ncbi:MAG: DIP1984 family protein [Candidatus Hydrogenedentes bacterium]|nr:DIP1984 family protein [Candidatus Hydrogenedentota bacterium]
MKLAEALLLRGDMQKKIESLRERITRNGMVQQGEKPSEDPNALIKEAFAVTDELESLVVAINRANLKHKLSDGRTITEAIARRDTLTKRHSLLLSAIKSSQEEPERYSMREIKWKATLPVAKLQKQADDVAVRIREINALIQESNWKVDL